jgi:hypothetical protein
VGFFIGARGDGDLGMSRRGRPDQGAKLGAQLPRWRWLAVAPAALAAEEYRRVEAS